MRKRLRAVCGALVPGLLLALLFCCPAAAMTGVREGLRLWADVVLPALLPFFVVTSLLHSCGALAAVSPLLRPVCRLLRLPDGLGGLLLASWISGAPNGARLLEPHLQDGSVTPAQAARFVSAATVTSPLFLIGTVGAYLGSPALGALIYGIHLLCAICNGALWRGLGGRETARSDAVFRTDERVSPLLALPGALRSACLSVLFVGAAIAFFSALTAALEALGLADALGRVLRFALPADAVQPLLEGFFEISRGAAQTAQAALPLPLRLSMLCGLSAFGGLSVLCQAQVFLGGRVSFAAYFAQRMTHAALSFAVMRGFCLLLGGVLPAFSPVESAVLMLPQQAYSLPILAACAVFSLVPWGRFLREKRVQGR